MRPSLRFEDHELEEAYRTEDALLSRRRLRLPLVIGGLFFAGGGYLDSVAGMAPAAVRMAWLMRFGFAMPAIAAAFAFTFAQPATFRRFWPVVGVSVCASTLCSMSAITSLAVGPDGDLAPWNLGYVLLGFVITLMTVHTVVIPQVQIAALGTAIGVPSVLWVLRNASAKTLVFAMFWLVTASTLGIIAGWVLERARRDVFHQRRLLAEERAKTEALLAAEVRHQVAARSRELGDALVDADAVIEHGHLSAGGIFDKRYRIERRLGAGGMGAVYEVERVTDNRHLALKLVVGTAAGAHAARFAREAEIGAGLRHPNLVSIIDVGIVRGGPFLVMELVAGGSLEERRERFGDIAWALPILRDIAAGIAALHAAGVVHRDLKPANVLLDEGVAKIADFGISRFDDALGATVEIGVTPRRQITQTGALIGTPMYMAPEGARGETSARADVFALGVVAYELFTGRAPFAIPPPMLAMAGQRLPTPARIENVPEQVGSIVIACLSEDPVARPRVAEVIEALG